MVQNGLNGSRSKKSTTEEAEVRGTIASEAVQNYKSERSDRAVQYDDEKGMTRGTRVHKTKAWKAINRL
jgi:hypothetical protein